MPLFNKIMEDLLSCLSLIGPITYPCSCKNSLVHNAWDRGSETPTTSASVDDYLLIFCFEDFRKIVAPPTFNIKTNHARIATITSTVPSQHQRNKPCLNGTNKPPSANTINVLKAITIIITDTYLKYRVSIRLLYTGYNTFYAIAITIS
jgi:hypothetical protein